MPMFTRINIQFSYCHIENERKKRKTNEDIIFAQQNSGFTVSHAYYVKKLLGIKL